jgi:hypothetical protein
MSIKLGIKLCRIFWEDPVMEIVGWNSIKIKLIFEFRNNK